MNENILRKVRALLAKAESPACTPEEAEVYSARATELVAKYSIDQALLESKSDLGIKPISRTFTAPAPYSKPKMHLAGFIARAYGLSTVVRNSTDTFTLVGFQSDLDAFDLLYTSLLVQGTLASTRGDKSYRTSFWLAYGQRLAQRLTAQRQQAVSDSGGTSTALVLVDRKKEVDRAFNAEFAGKLTKSAPSRFTSSGGIAAGRAAADRADLGTNNRVGARTAGALR